MPSQDEKDIASRGKSLMQWVNERKRNKKEKDNPIHPEEDEGFPKKEIIDLEDDEDEDDEEDFEDDEEEDEDEDENEKV